MSKSRHTEAQMIGALKQPEERGSEVQMRCRKTKKLLTPLCVCRVEPVRHRGLGVFQAG